MLLFSNKAFILAVFIALIAIHGGRAGELDALAISQNIQAKHLPFGTILDPIYASPISNQIVDYTRCGDSALWTGAYLAAEAFRYKVTGSTAAFTNLTQALAGLKSLADVTGTNLLARCLVPASSPFAASIASQEAANGIFTNSTTGDLWVGNTSRDEYTGAIFGLGVAYDMVGDPATRANISALATRLIQFLIGNNWSVVMPDGTVSTTFLIRPDEMLALLQVGQHINPSQFSSVYSQQRALASESILIPVAVDILNDDSYFKFNLDYMTFFSLIRLDSGATRVYQQAYEVVRGYTASHQNAFFDIVDRGLEGSNSTRDAETLTLLDEWLLRPSRDPYVDLTNSVSVCESQACEPIPIALRVPTDFLWQRSPFQLTGGGNNTIETAGIDYILPYWMARYYSVTPAFAVEPAAAPSVAVAPGSIASLYGTNLADQTASATSQPLPVTLGGITLRVTDASGTPRSAPLMYVSPVQINFQVPAAASTGTATFVLNTGTMMLTATGNILNTAPALFSANGNGSGVAAATAISVQAGAPQTQFTVSVFQCASSGCNPVPIDLGVDTPTYLTLYGTGIRNAGSLTDVQLTINGSSVPVFYAGAQPSFAGLDQVNVELPLTLRGSGLSNVVLTVDGRISNTVTIDVQ